MSESRITVTIEVQTWWGYKDRRVVDVDPGHGWVERAVPMMSFVMHVMDEAVQEAGTTWRLMNGRKGERRGPNMDKPNDDRYIRISGDVRVPASVDEDAFIEALLGLCHLHGWGFTGGARELTFEELYEDGADSGGE